MKLNRYSRRMSKKNSKIQNCRHSTSMNWSVCWGVMIQADIKSIRSEEADGNEVFQNMLGNQPRYLRAYPRKKL